MVDTDLNLDDLHDYLRQLEQSQHNHQQWYNNIVRTLVCKLHPDERDLDADSYKKCQFGQWYYGYSSPKLHGNPLFISMGAAHQEMHKFATVVLETAFNENNINMDDFDNLANSVERLQIEITSLTHEYETSLYAKDALTRAINRVDMLPIMRELHDMHKRDAMSCCLVMFDIDHFKLVNDKYGHQAGDKVLVAMTNYIMQNIRSYDKLFRYGGEEFIICMLQTDLNTCFHRTEQMRAGLAVLPIDIGQDQPINISASFGIAKLDSAYTIEQNIDHIDKAMYEAKKSGRNLTRIWESDIKK